MIYHKLSSWQVIWSNFDQSRSELGLDLLRESTRAEHALNLLQVTHTASTLSTTTESLLGPVVTTHLGVGETAGSAVLLLDMERALAATTAKLVSLVVTKTERTGTLATLTHSTLR